MQCPKCGKTIEGGVTFCGYCGAPILRMGHSRMGPALVLVGLAVLAILVGGSLGILVLRSASSTPTVIAYATLSPTRPAVSATPSSSLTATVIPSALPTPTPPVRTQTSAAPTATSIPATPIIIIVTATRPPSPTPLPTATPTPTPTPWFGFVSLRWEPSEPRWGDDVVFYAKFNNTLSEPRYLSWLIEICKPDCPNWRVLMFQTKRKEDNVPAGGVSEVASIPPWPLRGPGGTQTFPVRFVHVLPDDTRMGETIFYITISPR